MKLVAPTLLVILAAASPLALALEPWQTPLGPDGVTRIIVEAEDMQGVNPKAFGGTAPEWRAGRAGMDHYQCNTFGGHWQSRTRTAMTDAGDNAAELAADLEIPKAGRYKVWVKYECPPYFNYAFQVRLTPAGAAKPALDKTYGLIESAKHFCFTKAATTGSLYWSWGIDHDAAEGYEVDLPAGKARLTLAKTTNPAPAGMRSVDVVMITDKLSELSSPEFPRYPLLDELRRANHLFLRFTLARDAAGPVRIEWNRSAKRYNDFYNPQYKDLVRSYDRSGTWLAPPPEPPPETNAPAKGKPKPKPKAKAKPTGQLPGPLQPGETSVWLDIGPCLNVESASTFDCLATLLDGTGKAITNQPDTLAFTADIALAPDDKRIVKSFGVTRERPGRQLAFLLQPDLHTEEGLRWSLNLADVYRFVTDELDKTPRSAPIPRRIRFFSSTGSPLNRNAPGADWAWELAMDFRRAQGLNTFFGSATSLTPDDYIRQQAWAKTHGFELLTSASYHHSQDPDKVAETIQGLGTKDQFHYLSYGDEIGLPNVDATKPELVSAFQDYLKKRGVTPASLGVPAWDQVKPLSALSAEVAVKIGVLPEAGDSAEVDRTLKRLYWHSCQFRIHKGIEDFAAKTRRLRERLGPRVHTSANLGGMHPFYWMHQSSFIEAFRHQAMTLAWTEDYDYTQPETSRLVVEFQTGYLKAGTKYHGQRMQIYCMPHYPGQSPEHLLQNLVLEWGQNIKDVDWFVTVPDGFTTENYVNVRGGLPTFRALREATEMAGAVEEWLEPAQPVPADVALLLSEASDTWEAEGRGQNAVKPGSKATNAFQEERKNTYYALRHAGFRVDLLTEADVQEGRLKPYRALYLGGENLERATAPVLRDWVKAGGILYASAGAARKDEYDEPLAELDSLLGRGPSLTYERFQGPLRSKLELLFLKPLDTVTLADGAAFDALATLDRFKALPQAEVLATFAKGEPALVRMKTGTGAAFSCATFPGEAWAKKALPVMPAGRGGPDDSGRYPSFEPVAFDAAAASVILQPLRDAGLQPDVRLDKPLVVANRLAGPKGTVLTLVNLGHQQKGPVQDLGVTLAGMSKAARVWSYAHRKGVPHEIKDGALQFRLPSLNLVDLVVIENP